MKNKTIKGAARAMLRTITLVLPLVFASASYFGTASAQTEKYRGSMEQLFGFWKITTYVHAGVRHGASHDDLTAEAAVGRFVEFTPDRIWVPHANIPSHGNFAAMGFCRDVRYRTSKVTLQSVFRSHLDELPSAGIPLNIVETIAILCSTQLGTKLESNIIWMESETVMYFAEGVIYVLQKRSTAAQEGE